MSKLKSQIESMSGTAAAPAATRAQSQLELFTLAAIKGGAHTRTLMLSLIAYNVMEAYKGNSRNITESLKLCTGTSVKARAFLAGFTVLKDITKACPAGSDVPYTGKWDATANKELRAQVDVLVQAKTAAFANAFDAVFAKDKADKEKAKAGKTAAALAADSDETAAPASTGESTEARAHDTAAAQDEAVQAMIRLLRSGSLTGAQLDDIGEAVRAAEVRAELARIAAETAAAAPKAPAKRKGKQSAAAA